MHLDLFLQSLRQPIRWGTMTNYIRTSRRRNFLWGEIPSSLFFLDLFFVVLMLGVGAPAFSVLKFICLFTFQTLLGGLLWRRMGFDRSISSTEFIGIGFVLGLTCTTIVDQTLVFWDQRIIMIWLIFVLFSFFVFFQVKPDQPKVKKMSNSDISDLYVFVSFSVAGLAGYANGMNIVFVLSVASAFLFYLTRNRASRRFCLVLNGFILFGFFLVLRFSQPPNAFGPKYLRYLFSGSDDLIFSESLSNSMGHFGPWDNLAVAGHPIPYHWFTMAATSSMQSLIGSEPFFVTTIVTPILFLFLVLSLVSIVVLELIPGRIGVCIALIAVVFSSTYPKPEGDFQVIENFTTSNIVSFVWSLSAIFFLILFSKYKRSMYAFLLIVSAGLTFLSKVPHGVILFAAIIFYLLTAYMLKMVNFRQTAFVLFGLTLCFLGIYFSFLQPLAFQDRSFVFPVNSANLALDSSYYPLVPAALVLGFLLCRLPLFSVTRWSIFSPDAKAYLVGSIGATLVSLVRFVIYGASSESYFLNMGLMIGALLFGMSFNGYLRTINRNQRSILFVSFALGFSSYLISLFFTRSADLSWPFLLLPLPFAFLSFFFIFLFSRYRFHLRSIAYVAFLLNASLLGSSVAVHFATEFEPTAIEFSSDVVSLDELEALAWMRDSVVLDEIVATNRNLCGVRLACEFNETHQIISAFSGRQVFIEGPRFLNGARDYPDWANDRIRSSLNFSASPSIENSRTLTDQGVAIYYLVKGYSDVQQDRKEFTDVSELLFENPSIAIYKLNVQVPS